jgi:AcrR family transcriptional regulator
MSIPPDGQTRRRLATRQAISDAATRLFHRRGFDRVTVDDIAEAANVGRMTVFNHFPRKEDMFFDLEEAGRQELLMALKQRDLRVPPIEALRRFTHRVVTEQMPYVRFSSGSQLFIETVAASEVLKARAREIRDELVQLLVVALSESVGRRPDDPEAHLAAALIVTIWSVAFIEAHATFRKFQNAKEAQAVFLAVVDKGAVGLNAAMTGTLYASR